MFERTDLQGFTNDHLCMKLIVHTNLPPNANFMRVAYKPMVVEAVKQCLAFDGYDRLNLTRATFGGDLVTVSQYRYAQVEAVCIGGT
jgi:hypothetical protein